MPSPGFSISSIPDFQAAALDQFLFQYTNVGAYREFCDHLGTSPSNVSSLENIPFLPVEMFKSHSLIAGDAMPELVFRSSGTTGNNTSTHYVVDPALYRESILNGFKLFFGDPSGWCFFALLPSYLEREDSSLVYMVDRLIKASHNSYGGFYLYDHDEMLRNIRKAYSSGLKIMIIGVSFALLDLAENLSPDLSACTVVETGGMKGRREELTREELHNILKRGMNLKTIHSEYGMTELLSQAWSTGEGIFQCPPWMKILIRDSYDPAEILPAGRTGSINIIDLANRYSCSFLATSDLGRSNPEGHFEVLGRMDHSDLRGCNLLLG